MGLVEFFSSIADNFKNHYRQLAESVSIERPTLPDTQLPREDNLQISDPVKTDSYEPSEEAQQLADNNQLDNDEPVDINTPATPTQIDNNEESAPPTSDNPVTDYTTSLKRRAHLDYQMNLEFNLGAITRTVERLAEGDTKALEEFAAAGFGLKAAMDFKGHQLINVKSDSLDENPVHVRRMALNKSMQARQFAYQDRNFGVQSFYNEATRIQRNMNFNSHGTHRLAVNKFALRYRMDSSLSFAMLNRFNVQTEKFAENDPANLNDYLSTAGNAAVSSTEEMMGIFFEAVDTYLDSAEDQLVAKATEFFNMAAEELGFSGAIVDAAAENFVGTITGFFDRINTAVDNLQSQFVPQPELPPLDDAVVNPPVEYYVPTVTEDKAELAIA